jgi:uncharacterized protein YggE
MELSDRAYKLVIVTIILAAVFYLGNLVYKFQTLPQNYPQEITISGQGKVYAKPDIALISLGLKTEGQEIQKITQENTTVMNKIIKEVKDFGVEDKDIQTTLYSIIPQYNWTEKGGRFFTGYAVEQNIQIKVRNFDKIGNILSVGVNNKANNIEGLQFAIDNTDAVQVEARQKAINEAKIKAQTLSNQVGLKIAKLLNISEGNTLPQPLYKNAMGGANISSIESAVPDVQPGQLEFNSTITLTYRLK